MKKRPLNDRFADCLRIHGKEKMINAVTVYDDLTLAAQDALDCLEDMAIELSGEEKFEVEDVCNSLRESLDGATVE